MEKRNRYVMVATIVCFAAFGTLLGYLLLGSIHTLVAQTGQDELLAAPTPVSEIDENAHETVPEVSSAPLHQYVVTAQDGYLVVLSAGKTGEQMHTITSISISALPPEEQERLSNGIPIYDEMALFRILEDYGS